ncbi:MAG: PfkB family carbohydrate kinase [Sphaerochaetaceae bacterium]
MEHSVLAVGLNPVMQKTIVLNQLWENEVNRSNEYIFTVAGKGANTARVLNELGANPIHLSHAGGLFRETFLKMLKDDGITSTIVDSKSEIRLCYTLINKEKSTVTEIVEEALPVDPQCDNRLRAEYKKAIKKVALVTISGTKARGYKEDIVPWMVEEATKLGKMIVLDVCGDDLLNSLKFRPTLINPNLKEFSETLFPEALFMEHKPQDEILQIVKEKMLELEKVYGITTVLTQGVKSIFSNQKGAIVEHKVEPVTPVNTIGSGDAFTAGVAYGLTKSLPLNRCIEIGIACGKANALNLKTGTIEGGDIPL